MSVAATLSLCPATLPAAALPDPDLSPLIASLGLPAADEGADLLPAGTFAWHSSVATASHAVQAEAADEALLFDGETTRFAFGVEIGVSSRLQLGIEVPYLLQESGGLDNVVDTWHGWFGLPDGIRDDLPQDQLLYSYRSDGVETLDFRRNVRGIGDVRLTAGWQLSGSAARRIALRAALKLPTGDSEKLAGNDAAVISLGIAAEQDGLFGRQRMSGFYRGSVVALDRPRRLPDRAKSLIGVLAGGVSLRASRRIELTVQSRLRTAAYDSDLRLLGEPSLMLSAGGIVTLTDNLQLSIAVGEDIRVESAPDVTFALSLRYSPASR